MYLYMCASRVESSARASQVSARVHDADVVQVRHEQLEHRVRAAQRAPHGQVHALCHQMCVREVQHQLLVARVRHVEPLLRLEPASVYIVCVRVDGYHKHNDALHCSRRALEWHSSIRLQLSDQQWLALAVKCVLLSLYQTFGGSVGTNTGFCSPSRCCSWIASGTSCLSDVRKKSAIGATIGRPAPARPSIIACSHTHTHTATRLTFACVQSYSAREASQCKSRAEILVHILVL